MSQRLDKSWIQGRHACAMVLKCSIQMIKEKPEFKHGITRKEMEATFPRIMGFTLATYGNRLRDNANADPPLMGRHDVHGERHFFPLCLDEQELIDHSRCNCQK